MSTSTEEKKVAEIDWDERTTVLVRLTLAERRAMKIAAAEQNKSMNAFILELIREKIG